MKQQTVEEILDAFLVEVVSKLGFQRVEALIYSKTVNEGQGYLYFPFRIDPRGPRYFSCNVGLRFESLERLLRGLSEKSRPTVMTPLHLLRPNQSVFEYKFITLDDLKLLNESLVSDLKEYAMPFIEQYSTLAGLRRELEATTPKNYFVLDAEGKLVTLAGILFTHGEKPFAIKILHEALLARANDLPKKRILLERALKEMTPPSTP